MNYLPRLYPGTITHFRPSKEYARHNSEKVGWHDLSAGGVETHKLPVYPAGMLLEPFVGILAERLKSCIECAVEFSEYSDRSWHINWCRLPVNNDQRSINPYANIDRFIYRNKAFIFVANNLPISAYPASLGCIASFISFSSQLSTLWINEYISVIYKLVLGYELSIAFSLAL